ncbi:MAG: lysine-2,3-aminomutase-like protein [Alphaproteobacteria bacterium]|nr:lysine-2,3-aminomutase-like protein [Alphaproteobacteria bacterium]
MLQPQAITSPDDLLRAGLIPPDHLGAVVEASATLPVSITAHIAGMIDPASSNDAIAKQFVPSALENNRQAEELTDPIGDIPHSPVAGIVHRYPDRVLLTPVLTCPVYCRFCFRREAVGDGLLTASKLNTALDYIRNHTEIWEVILSGGDPLIMSPRRLTQIIDALDEIDHVAVIRIHTRVPVVDPERITETLITALKRTTPVFIVLHCNHADELVAEAEKAISRLVDKGFPLLSQSVLLKGINDDPESLTALMKKLVRSRVKPYYLHHGDKAQGTSHFRTTLAAGRAIVSTLRGRLSGLCQPTYMLDIPGGHGKVPAADDYLRATDDSNWIVTDWQGNTHKYHD